VIYFYSHVSFVRQYQYIVYTELSILEL